MISIFGLLMSCDWKTGEHVIERTFAMLLALRSAVPSGADVLGNYDRL